MLDHNQIGLRNVCAIADYMKMKLSVDDRSPEEQSGGAFIRFVKRELDVTLDNAGNVTAIEGRRVIPPDKHHDSFWFFPEYPPTSEQMNAACDAILAEFDDREVVSFNSCLEPVRASVGFAFMRSPRTIALTRLAIEDLLHRDVIMESDIENDAYELVDPNQVEIAERAIVQALKERKPQIRECPREGMMTHG